MVLSANTASAISKKEPITASQVARLLEQLYLGLQESTFESDDEEKITDLIKAVMDDNFSDFELKVGKTMCSDTDGMGDLLSLFVKTYEGEVADLKSVCISRIDKYKVTLYF
jgi:hypothetical protein